MRSVKRTVRVEVASVEELAGQRWVVVRGQGEVFAVLTPEMDVLDLFDLHDALERFGVALRSADLARAGIVA